MKVLNIPISNVVRHYDASRKNCPAELNINNWDEWYLFKTYIKFTNSPEYWINNSTYDPNFVKKLLTNIGKNL